MLQEAKNGGSGEDEKVRLTRIVGRGAMIGDHKHVEQLKLALAHHDKPAPLRITCLGNLASPSPPTRSVCPVKAIPKKKPRPGRSGGELKIFKSRRAPNFSPIGRSGLSVDASCHSYLGMLQYSAEIMNAIFAFQACRRLRKITRSTVTSDLQSQIVYA